MDDLITLQFTFNVEDDPTSPANVVNLKLLKLEVQ